MRREFFHCKRMTFTEYGKVFFHCSKFSTSCTSCTRWNSVSTRTNCTLPYGRVGRTLYLNAKIQSKTKNRPHFNFKHPSRSLHTFRAPKCEGYMRFGCTSYLHLKGSKFCNCNKQTNRKSFCGNLFGNKNYLNYLLFSSHFKEIITILMALKFCTPYLCLSRAR